MEIDKNKPIIKAEWQEEICRECVTCGDVIMLDDGCEWVDDEESTLCWKCQNEKIKQLQAIINKVP
jgi:hypothetical protein